MAKAKSAVAAKSAATEVMSTQGATGAASAVTKLTKRNATPVDAHLGLTDKASKMRAGHNKAAWDAITPLLPASAATLAKLPILNERPIVASQFISYAIRRGLLQVVPTPAAKPAKRSSKKK
jgi:hypothetical protein